jgi:hypothetical protein
MIGSAWTPEANATCLGKVLPHSLSPRRLDPIGDSLRRDQESRTRGPDWNFSTPWIASTLPGDAIGDVLMKGLADSSSI